MRTPWPIWGGKGRVAAAVWRRWGDPAYYFEPFVGAGAVLLGRPRPGKYEFIGDLDGLISNFWRSTKYAPHEVAEWADDPPNGIDKVARLNYLESRLPELVARLEADTDYHDARLAGYYAYTQSLSVYGGGSHNGPSLRLDRPAGFMRERARGTLYDYVRQLAQRLANVTVYHGHWGRMARCALRMPGRDTGVFLDPPYGKASGRRPGLYTTDSHSVARYVKRWALAAAKTGVRVALCGYDGEHDDMPADWEEFPWASQWGQTRERIWFSPPAGT
jgi:site-specific DNA-adenine methylase